MPHHTYADQELNKKYGIVQDYNHFEEEQIAKEMHVDPWRGYHVRGDSEHVRYNTSNIFIVTLSVALGLYMALKYIELFRNH